jgi:hypothetical protein
MELFGPADEEYIRELSRIGAPILLTMSSESGVDSVRRAHGRNYNNAELLETIALCKRYDIALGIFSMAALGNDTPETIKETWKSWEQICSLRLNRQAPVDYAFGPMILLDPGSLAFDSPSNFGYHRIFKSLEDYVKGMSRPAWHQWISYETRHLNKNMIAQLMVESLEYSINLRERCGFYTKGEADTARFCYVQAGKETIAVVNEAMKIRNKRGRMKKLYALRNSLDRRLMEMPVQS